jgi:hypothetical protein
VLDQPLGLTVHSLPRPEEAGDGARRTVQGRWRLLGLAAICAAPVIASYFTYYVVRPGQRMHRQAQRLVKHVGFSGGGR